MMGSMSKKDSFALLDAFVEAGGNFVSALRERGKSRQGPNADPCRPIVLQIDTVGPLIHSFILDDMNSDPLFELRQSTIRTKSPRCVVDLGCLSRLVQGLILPDRLAPSEMARRVDGRAQQPGPDGHRDQVH